MQGERWKSQTLPYPDLSQLPVPLPTIPVQARVSNGPSGGVVALAALLASLRTANGKFRSAPCSPIAVFASPGPIATHRRMLIATAASVTVVGGKSVAVPVQTAETPAVAVMAEVESARAGVSPERGKDNLQYLQSARELIVLSRTPWI